MIDQKPATRRLRIFLRDFRMIEATVSWAEGQSLATYFANRKQYVNLIGAHWASTQEQAEHVALKVDQVLWVAAPDGDISLTSASVVPLERTVEIQLDGGLLVRAGMLIAAKQRLTDYMESAQQFVPLTGAQLLRSGRPPKKVNVTLGNIMLNQHAIQALWEILSVPIERPGPAVGDSVEAGRADDLEGIH
ncbi:MAG: hypothetical protein ABIV28_07405 [Longimicrobiales bacterium]